jgi:hypothetical protein
MAFVETLAESYLSWLSRQIQLAIGLSLAGQILLACLWTPETAARAPVLCAAGTALAGIAISRAALRAEALSKRGILILRGHGERTRVDLSGALHPGMRRLARMMPLLAALALFGLADPEPVRSLAAAAGRGWVAAAIALPIAGVLWPRRVSRREKAICVLEAAGEARRVKTWVR